MSVPIDGLVRWVWASGGYVGGRTTAQVIEVRRGYLKRRYAADGHWTADWTPTEAWRELPTAEQASVQWQGGAGNTGIKTATIDIANVYAQQLVGALGAYHKTEQGWFSPLRSYRAPYAPPGKAKVTANEWQMTLTEAAEIRVRQGYGTTLYTTFSGLIDSVTGASKPSTLRVTARDWGLLLVDCELWGWNIDPKLRTPLSFVDRAQVRRYERSSDPSNRAIAEGWRKHAVLIDDVTDIAYHALRWAGFPKDSIRIEKAGVPLKTSAGFGYTEHLMDLVTKVCNATGFIFFVGLPTDAHPMGQPTLRRTHAITAPAPVEQVRAENILTGFSWQHDNTNLPAIVRVRGKPVPPSQGGVALSNFGSAIMDVYRPPWHVRDRDARVLKHWVHTEPLYTTNDQCAVAARYIALSQALAANTATIEVPGHPGLEVDDVIGVVDATSGVSSRAVISSIQSTFTRRPRDWKLSLSCYLLDNPDVVEVISDLHHVLVGRSNRYPKITGVVV